MTPRKPTNPATAASAPEPPVPSLEVSVARLQERVNGFHEKTFPVFCKGLDDRLDGFAERLGSFEGKLDKAVIKNGEFDDVRLMAKEWKDSNLRREGAVSVLRFSWRFAAWGSGLAVSAGLSGSGLFWLLGRITGHI